jgi:hypothetical protein
MNKQWEPDSTPKKSKALAIGNWKEPASVLGIELHDQVNMLEVTFGTNIANSTTDSWGCIIRVVRAQARKAYARNLCLMQRIQYVQLYLLAKIWYMPQILTPTKVHTQQLTSVCTWFIWQGAIFRVPVTTLQCPKEQGGWALPDTEVKCRTLLYSRTWMLSARDGSITAELMRKWDLTAILANSSNVNGIPTKMAYIRQYAIDMAYVTPPDVNETMKKFKQRLYGVLQIMANTDTKKTPNCVCGSPKNTPESHGHEYGQSYMQQEYLTQLNRRGTQGYTE